MSLQPRDVQDFRFKQLRKLRVFADEQNAVIHYRPKCAVATSNKYGLIFAGCPTGFKVLDVNNSLNYDDDKQLMRIEVADFQHQHVPFPCFPSHLSLSHDDLMLIVCVVKDGCQHAFVYDIRTFADKSQVAEPFIEFRLSSTPGVAVRDVVWSPAVNNMVAACLSDGSVLIYELNDASFTISACLPPATEATTICWSPKGKQIIVGKKNGTLAQHKPNLQEVKFIPCPNVFENPVSVVSVAWLSSFSFAVTYVHADEDHGSPSLVIINTPNNAAPSFVTYEDICYGSGEVFRTSYLLIHQSDWNVILCMSTNSMEIGVLGRNDNKVTWEQWILEDSGRAELPLEGNVETFPIGMAVSYNSVREINLGDNRCLPPMPIMFLLSTNGLLCPFHMISLHPGHQNLLKRIESLTSTGQRKRQASKFVTGPVISAVGSLRPTPEANKALLPTPTIFSNPAALMSGDGNKISPADVARFSISPQDISQQANSQGSIMTGMPLLTPPHTVSPFSVPIQSTPVKNPEVGMPHTSIFRNRGFSAPTQSSLFGNTADGKVPPNVISPLLAKQESAPHFSPSAAVQPVKPSITQSAIGDAGPTTPLTIAKYGFTRTSRSAASAFQPTTAAISKNANLSVSGDNHLTPPPADALEISRTGKESLHLKNVFAAAIHEEMNNFNKELQELKKQTRLSSCVVGTPEELLTLKQSTESLRKFCDSIQQLTKELNQEVNDVRTEMLETHAMFEESQSLHKRNKDPRYRSLLKSRSLDHSSSKKLHHIHQLYHYIDTQIREVHHQMDEAEDAIKSRKKSKGLYLPSIETIYQTILNMQNILSVLPRKIDLLEERLESMKMQKYLSVRLPVSHRIPFYKSAKGEVDITTLTETLMSANLSPCVAEAKSKKLTAQKEAQLRSLFSNRLVTPVRSSAPGNLSRLLMPDISSIFNVTEQSGSLAKDENATPAGMSKMPITPTTTTSTSLTQLAVTSLNNSFRPVVTAPVRTSSVSPNAAPIQIPVQFSSIAGRGETSAHPVPSNTKSIVKPFLLANNTKSTETQSSLKHPASSPLTTAYGGPSTFSGTASVAATLSTNVSSPSFGFGTRFTPVVSSPSSSSSVFTVGSSTKSPTSSFGGGPSLFTLGTNKNALSTFQFKPVVESGASKSAATFSFTLDRHKAASSPPGTTASPPESKSLFSFGSSSVTKIFQFGGQESGEPSSSFAADNVEIASAKGFEAVIPEEENVETPPSTPVEEIRNAELAELGADFNADDDDRYAVAEQVVSEESPEEEHYGVPLSAVEGFPAVETQFAEQSHVAGTNTVERYEETELLSTSKLQHEDVSSSSLESTTTGAPERTAAVSAPQETPSPKPAVPENEGPASPALISSPKLPDYNNAVAPSSPSSFPTSPAPLETAESTSAPAFGADLTKAQILAPPTTDPPSYGSLFAPPPAATTASTAGQFSFCIGNQTIFGGTTTNTLAGGSQPTTVTSAFVTSSMLPEGGTFGFGGPTAFGAATTSPAPSFGTTTAPLFGGGQAPLFGQGATPPFGGTSPLMGQPNSNLMGNNAASPVNFGQNSGGFFSGLGGKPSPENANKNVFSGMSAFGAPPATANLFGNQSPTGTFGNKFGSSGFGSSSGSFTAGGGNSVAQSGFGGFQHGTATTPPKPSGFGGSPSFGAAPVFGNPPATFGSTAPMFGSPPPYGSPVASSASGFSNFAGNNSSPTFGGLAAQTSAPTFGGVGQQSPPPFGAPPAGFGAPANFGSNATNFTGGGFGTQQQQSSGASFSQWR